MDQCSHWFNMGGVLARDTVALPVRTSADGLGPRIPKIWDRCPVCGQFVLQYPRLTAQVVYDDGLPLFFDGAKDLFAYLLSPRRSTSAPYLVPIRRVYVTNFSGGEMIDARGAFFVLGSDVFGPTGPDLIAHGSETEAHEFMQDHHGTRIIEYPYLRAGVYDLTRGGWT